MEAAKNTNAAADKLTKRNYFPYELVDPLQPPQTMNRFQFLLDDIGFYALNVLGFCLVALVTWLWTRLRAARLDRAYQAQLQALRLQQADAYQAPALHLAEQRERMRRLLYGMRQALQEDHLQALRQYRHQLSHALILDYLPAAVRLWALQRPLEGAQPSAAWIDDAVAPTLETCRQVLAGLNAAPVLSALPTATEVVLQPQEVAFAFRLLREAGQERRARAFAKALDLQWDAKRYAA